MEKYRIGVLRILTTDDENVFIHHENLLRKLFPQFELTTRSIPDQPEGVCDDASYEKAVPKIIALAKEWEKDLDGLIVNCAGDPAVDILQKELHIPVVGAGRCTALAALLYPGKVGVLGLTGDIPPAYKEVLGDRLAGYEKPQRSVTANDLRTEEGIRDTREAVQRLIDEDAETIVFACTGYTMSDTKQTLKGLDIRILDCAQIMGAAMLSECITRYEYGNGR